MNVKVLSLMSAFLVCGCVSAASDVESAPQCGAVGHSRAYAREAAAPDDMDDEWDDRDPSMFAARSGGQSLVLVRVDGKYITGPKVSLGRYHEEDGRALRGVALGNIVDLRIEPTRVKGAIDNHPVSLFVHRRGNSLTVRGVAPGHVMRLHIDEKGMKGIVGGCSYSLIRDPKSELTTFMGRRMCRGVGMHNFTLELPSTMASWSDADIAAALVVLLRKS